MKVETDRLILRVFQPKDASGLLEYLSTPSVNCFVSEAIHSEAEALAYMSEQHEGMQRIAVCLKEDDAIVGDLFALREGDDTYNVGWNFNKKVEGKGLAYEAAYAMIQDLFDNNCARRIYAYVEIDNQRSQNLCRRLGMRLEGCFKEFISFVNNPDGTPRYEDTCVFAILKKEWKRFDDDKSNL